MIKEIHVIIYDTKVKKHIIYDDYCADEDEAILRAENNMMYEGWYPLDYVNEFIKIFACEA